MTQQEIIDFINDRFIYKPGWNIKASKPRPTALGPSIDPYFQENHVMVNYSFSVVDSITRNPDVGATGTGEAILDVNRMPDEKTVRAILLVLMFFTELHEVREFVTVDGERPFNPHTNEGDDAFAEAMALPIVIEILKNSKVFG